MTSISGVNLRNICTKPFKGNICLIICNNLYSQGCLSGADWWEPHVQAELLQLTFFQQTDTLSTSSGALNMRCLNLSVIISLLPPRWRESAEGFPCPDGKQVRTLCSLGSADMREGWKAQWDDGDLREGWKALWNYWDARPPRNTQPWSMLFLPVLVGLVGMTTKGCRCF